MLLAIDIGNTDAVFAVFEGESLQKSWRVKTVLLDKHEALRQSFDGLDVDAVIISSVVPAVDAAIQEFCRADLGCDPLIVSNEIVPITLDFDRPEEVGADRIVNAVAVLEHYQTPAIVIDFGTATTFDVIDEQGRYCGGVIAPGVNLSVAALHEATAKLPSVSIEKPDRVIGRDTVSAMQSGIYWGYVGLIEGLIGKIGAELGGEPFVIATGGLAPLFAQSMDIINKVDNELTLKGLLKIYQEHKDI